jgi:hypothetical protein
MPKPIDLSLVTKLVECALAWREAQTRLSSAGEFDALCAAVDALKAEAMRHALDSFREASAPPIYRRFVLPHDNGAELTLPADPEALRTSQVTAAQAEAPTREVSVTLEPPPFTAPEPAEFSCPAV